MDSKLRVLITTGDPDGIGLEVTLKALNLLGPKPDVQFTFFTKSGAAKLRRPEFKKFKIKTVSSLEEAVNQPFDPKSAIEIASERQPAEWVEESAQACLDKRFSALVTAPLSKIAIRDAGFADIGHTEILARVSGRKHLFMGFVGKKFNVVLATGHSPLSGALGELSPELLKRALVAAAALRSILPGNRSRLPVAVVGVNPHASEEGLIGQEETWMSSVLKGRENVEGPLVPDAAFLPANWKRYSVFVCPYHDQGLIPFKMVHGFSGGVHLTLGLPFVRTSVDHGTAKDLFGKDKAEPGSMKDAIATAIRLAKEAEQ